MAVGTTSVRTLEYAARQTNDGRIVAQSGEADIFIYPGFDFRVVGAMLTNFHLPKSTLIMLVSAFAGRERACAPMSMPCDSAIGSTRMGTACLWNKKGTDSRAGSDGLEWLVRWAISVQHLRDETMVLA